MPYKETVESLVERLESAVKRLERLESTINENILRKDDAITRLKRECQQHREAKEGLWKQLQQERLKK